MLNEKTKGSYLFRTPTILLSKIIIVVANRVNLYLVRKSVGRRKFMNSLLIISQVGSIGTLEFEETERRH